MPEPEAFEGYPLSTVISFWAISLLGYAAGFILLYMAWPPFALLFLAYLIGLELVAYRQGCASCYYYGKRCFSARGLVAGSMFGRQDPGRFCEKQVDWKSLLPQILLMVIPIGAGIYLLTGGFSWAIIVLMLIPPVLWFAGNPTIYGRLGCPHCKQGRICCPANDFFGKKVQEDVVSTGPTGPPGPRQ